MTDKFYETPEFRRIQKEWYSKLKDSGFDDIEGGYSDSPYIAGPIHIPVDYASSATTEKVFNSASIHLEELQGRQRTREHIVRQSLGRIDSDLWLLMLFISQGASERECGRAFGRTRHWVRSMSVAYHNACRAYANGDSWSMVEEALSLGPEIPVVS